MKASMADKIMLLLFAVSTLLMSVGCSKRITPTSIKTDSTFTSTTTVQRDTIITIGADSSVVELSLEQPGLHHEPGTAPAPSKAIVKKGSHSVVTIQRTGQTVTATCLCPELEVKARLYDQLVKTTREKQEVVTKVIRETYIPKFTLYMSYVGIVFLLLLVIGLGLKLFKLL